ncbi:MAG: TlpA family protein disulfide reductase [Chitinophaga sp.]|uniref:TlpA family protein disulfide reductase n=1 Tax=Chitinophaga sp. TaxID=1869181 RepID=UPI001B06D6F2|nr:TlpA disulfide reductase family protein [Chitinophaga sp.]MBO9732104.1 TlpA family protein disulfide reductase [Chitinophaga sp.]
MKTSIITVICCLYAAIIFGQKKEATIVLDISPLKVDSVWIADGEQSVFMVAPNKEGKVTHRFTGTFPKSIRVGIDSPKKGQMYLFLESGDKLNIKTDFEEKTTFSGPGAENAKVLWKYFYQYLLDYKNINATNLTVKEYLDTVNRMEQASIDILEANKRKVTPVFYKDQSISLKYRKLGSLVLAPYFYHLGFKKKMSEVLSDDYWKLCDNIEMRDDLINNESYNAFMRGSYPAYMGWRELYQQGKLDSSYEYPQALKQRLKLIEQHYTGKLRSMAMKTTLNSLIGMEKDVASLKPAIDNYVAKYATKEDAKFIQESYAKTLSLAAGKVPPFFTLKDLNGKDVTLKDFAGKVIYMDFWASWCTPCRYEMKNGSPKLHEKFKDNKQVVFLYISIDDKEANWKKAIEDDKIEGIHLLSAGGMKSAVANAFNIHGVPRYIIIGRDGKIFDADASRPSEDKTPARIEEALNAQ